MTLVEEVRFLFAIFLFGLMVGGGAAVAYLLSERIIKSIRSWIHR